MDDSIHFPLKPRKFSGFYLRSTAPWLTKSHHPRSFEAIKAMRAKIAAGVATATLNTRRSPLPNRRGRTLDK